MTSITVLLIEDNPGDAGLIRKMLLANRRQRFILKLSESLAGGLEALAAHPVDVILLDLSLPDSQGLSTLDRALRAAPTTPIVVLTGLDDDLGIQAVAHGAQDYLLKDQINENLLARALTYAIERMRTEIALRESEERYRRLVENARDIIYRFRLRPTPGFDYVNPAVTQITGYTPEEHYANPNLGFEIVHPDDRPILERLMQSDDFNQNIELRWIHKDGRTIWTEQHNIPVYDADGALIAIEGVARDISDRKHAALALQEKERQLRSILESSKDGVLLTDEDGRVIEWNPAQEQITGVSRAEAIGQPFWDVHLQLTLPEHRNEVLRQRIRSAVEALLENKPDAVLRSLVEREIHRPDGARVFVQYSTFLITTRRGSKLGAIVRDITAQKQAEDMLDESRRLLQGTLDALTAHIAILDETGVIIAVNAAWRRFADENDLCDPTYGIGTSYLTVCEAVTGQDAKQAAAVASSIRQILDGEQTDYYLEYPCHSEQVQRWFSMRLNPFEIDGKLRIVASHVDITERVKADQAQREQFQLASALSATAAILSTELDLELVLNKLLEHVGNVAPHEASHIMLIDGDRVRPVRWRGYPASSEELFRTFSFKLDDTPLHRQMFTTRQPVVVPDTYASPDWISVPQTEWIRSYAATPILSHGRVIGFLELDSSKPGFFTQEHVERLKIFAHQAAIAIQNAQLYDAVRNYALEQEKRVIERTAALNRSIERIETILNSSSDAITVIRGDGRIDQTNPAFDAMFGYEIMEIIRQPLAQVVAPANQIALDEAMQAVIDYRQAQRIEIVAQRKDGTQFDAELALSPVIVDDQIANIVCSLRDISQHKQLEDSLRAALAKERELSELKTRFTSMISHEFRTPLATILSSSGLLEEYSDRLSEQKRREHLAKIQAQVKYMAELLDNILMIGKMQAVGLDFKPAPVNLLELCQDVFEGIQISANSNIDFDFIHEGDEFDVVMDEKLIRHILVNLLSNAVKYSPDGGKVTLHLRRRGDEVIIQVSDQGLGIPLKDQEHIFKPFHRAENVSTIKGTGLGLAIVKNSVDLHGGVIEVASEVGSGTTFTVSLPIGEKDDDQNPGD